MTATQALFGATMLHLGFQVVVTLLVYPGFAAVPPDDWPAVHAAHGRRIGPIVVVVYGALIAASWATVASGPGTAEVTAVLAAATAVVVTATVAGPAHARLSPDRPPGLLRRLLVADRVRLVAAVVAAVAATVAVVTA